MHGTKDIIEMIFIFSASQENIPGYSKRLFFLVHRNFTDFSVLGVSCFSSWFLAVSGYKDSELFQHLTKFTYYMYFELLLVI